MDEPLHPAEAKRILRRILAEGTVWKSRTHLDEELAEDELEFLDCVNVLRGGVVEPAEWESGAWRYRVRTQKIVVVVEIEVEELGVTIVTAWRI